MRGFSKEATKPVTAAVKPTKKTAFQGRTLPAWNHSRRRNRMVTGFSRSSCTSRPCIKDYVLLDAGCGTGILSIAAVKLGAAKALAVDIDEEAVRSAARNIEINGVSDKITVALEDVKEGVYEENAGTAQGGEKKLYDADIVAANLISGLIIDLAGDIRKYLEPGGIFIASGILGSQGGDVASKLVESGFEVIDNLTDGDWTAFAARSK
jgi:ribosomal protein L11 methyltransferase